jgi:hypothetical protein
MEINCIVFHSHSGFLASPHKDDDEKSPFMMRNETKFIPLPFYFAVMNHNFRKLSHTHGMEEKERCKSNFNLYARCAHLSVLANRT